jgi:Fe-S cluster biogenesis protein NfuA
VTTPVDTALLERRIGQVRAVMRAHAGAIDLVEVTPAGVVRVRFTGMCAGCPFRPLTMRGTILPALSELPGVTGVEAAGARISDEAAARVQRYLGDRAPRLPPLAPVPEVPG